MSSNTAIKIDNVWKRYSKKDISHNSIREDFVNFLLHRNKDKDKLNDSEFWALKGINLEVKKGECLGIYGRNGSGKSTILKLIANVTYPTKGSIVTFGEIAPLIEIGAGFHPDLTGRENIFMNGTILGMSIQEIKEKMENILKFSEIDDFFIDMPVKKYSSGMYLRLAFSIAIYSEADTYLFDEILAVGDEKFRNKCFNKIDELRKLGKTMIIVMHNKELLEKITDRVVFIEKGKIVL